MDCLQTLTIKDVLIAARKVINEGRLQAQQPIDSKSGSPTCTNQYFKDDGTEIRCVVGSALSDEVLAKLNEDERVSSGIYALVGYYEGTLEPFQMDDSTYPLVKAASDKDFNLISNLQQAHDRAVRYNELPRFLEHFEELEKEYGLTANTDA